MVTNIYARNLASVCTIHMRACQLMCVSGMRERERGGGTDRQADRQTDRDRDRETHRHTERPTHRDRQTGRQKNRQRDCVFGDEVSAK